MFALKVFNTFMHSCAILYVKFVYFIVNSFFEGRAYGNVYKWEVHEQLSYSKSQRVIDSKKCVHC